jgi:hypothetical protein
MKKEKLTLENLETYENAVNLLKAIDAGLKIYNSKTATIKQNSNGEIETIADAGLEIARSGSRQNRIIDFGNVALYGHYISGKLSVPLIEGSEKMFKAYFVKALNEHISGIISEARRLLFDDIIEYKQNAISEIGDILNFLNKDKIPRKPEEDLEFIEDEEAEDFYFDAIKKPNKTQKTQSVYFPICPSCGDPIGRERHICDEFNFIK